MFCVLLLEKEKKTFLDRIIKSRLKDKHHFETVPVFKGAPFYKLTVTYKNEAPCWDEIYKITGRCSQKLVMNDNIILPRDARFGAFKGVEYHKLLMENMFLKIIIENCETIRNRGIVIIDKNGKKVDFIKKVALCVKKMTVVTQEKENYGKVIDEIIDETGLCISVQSKMEDDDICVDLDNCVMKIRLNSRTVVISKGDDIVVPPIYSELLPETIDKVDFYGALYELCGVFSLSECYFDSLYEKDKKIRWDQVPFT